MYLPISFRSISTIFAILLFAVSAIAQDDPAERPAAIEVRMYLVLGTDGPAAGIVIPKVLENTISALRREATHKNFALLDMQLGRMADRGMVESRGVLDLKQSSFPGHAVYSNFQITDVRSGNGTTQIMLGTVQSGLKIPVRSVSGPAGATAVVSYENIGYVGKRIAVSSGIPTVVGSYSVPTVGGTVYVVLTATHLAI